MEDPLNHFLRTSDMDWGYVSRRRHFYGAQRHACWQPRYFPTDFDTVDLIAHLCTQAVSVASGWDHVRHRPVVLAALTIAAMTDTISEQLQVSLVLGAFHVMTMWIIGRGRYV